MRTVVLDPPPVEVERMIERRRRLGLDMHDEIWEGEYHVVPGPAGPHSELDQQLAVLFDETWQKLGFYAAHHVDEVVIVDPSERSVDWLVLAGARYEPAETSGLVPFGPGELAARIDWPDPPSA
jgi:hypothetical protein